MDPEQLDRLEDIVSKLEAVAGTLSGGKIGGGNTSSPAEVSAISQAYNDFYGEFVQPFVDAAKGLDGTQKISTFAETAFTFLGKVVGATKSYKKPKQSHLMKFVKPIVDVVVGADKLCDNRSAFHPHQKAFHEIISSMNFLFVPTPVSYIKGQNEAAEFYLNKILKIAKGSQTGAAEHKAFQQTLKVVLVGLGAFVKQHATTGLVWNPKGEALPTSASDLGDEKAAPAKKRVNKKKKKAAGGMDAVFASLNKGLSITGALKKVDKKDRNKYMTEEQKQEAAAKALALQKKAPKPKVRVDKDKPTKASNLGLDEGTWYVDYFYKDNLIEIDEAKMKHNVYVMGCVDCTINVSVKVKSIALDRCKRVKIFCKDVVSSVELVNCDRTKVFCNGIVPSIAIDKSTGVGVILSEAAVAEMIPTIITSSSSEMNVQVPPTFVGRKAEDDPLELALAEQFTQTVNKDGTITAEMIKHG